MANDTNNPGGPWVLDTTGTITSGRVKVRKFRLVPAAAAALASIQNAAGDTQAALAAAANGTSDEIDFGPNGKWIDGIKLATLSGTGAKLYVYCA